VTSSSAPIIDESSIESALLGNRSASLSRVREILAKALTMKGLDPLEVAVLSGVSDPELLGEMFHAARRVKEEIYGRRLVIFAPLYISNLCANECLYCAFRARNAEVKRRALTQEEIAEEVRHLVREGHKRVLLVAGESYPKEGLDYVLKAIGTVYATREGHGEIRRVNVNVAPLDLGEFKRLKEAGIGTYQLFQETYHRETYGRVHLRGKKTDYDWRVTCMDRAMGAGIDDVGIGVLFGLADWRFEILALMQHIRHLEATFGVGPHTISVPRLEPATGSQMASHPPQPVSDVDFRKIVAILRLAVPYTGIIMSTRETANIRRESFALGVSQISAGSRTNPGGYAEDQKNDEAQFCLGDERHLDVREHLAALRVEIVDPDHVAGLVGGELAGDEDELRGRLDARDLRVLPEGRAQRRWIEDGDVGHGVVLGRGWWGSTGIIRHVGGAPRTAPVPAAVLDTAPPIGRTLRIMRGTLRFSPVVRPVPPRRP